MRIEDLDMTREEGVLGALLHRAHRIERALELDPNDQIMQRHCTIANAHLDGALNNADVWVALTAQEIADALDQGDRIRVDAQAALFERTNALTDPLYVESMPG